MAKTIQSSGSNTYTNEIRRNTKAMNNFSYWLGGIDVTHQNLEQFDPYIRGVSRLFLHKPPLYMQQVFPGETTRFKQYFETGYTAISGIQDLSVEFTEFEGGFNGQRFSNVSMSHDDTESIQVSMYELSGSPIREYLETWISGVRDPRSGIAHYHGAIEDKSVSYKEINHTAEIVYVNLDPTAKYLEYSCLLAHVFPTKVPKDHLNFEKGNRDNALLDLEFRVTKYESPAINDIGCWYIANSLVNYSYLDFDPHIITSPKGDAGSGYKDGYSYNYGKDGTQSSTIG